MVVATSCMLPVGGCIEHRTTAAPWAGYHPGRSLRLGTERLSVPGHIQNACGPVV